MSAVYLIDGVRTPIGAFGGSLARTRADDMAAHVIRKVIERQPNADPARIDDVIFGCANQAGEDNRNVARMAALLAGLPVEVPGQTVNRLCASGLAAVANAFHAISAGEGDLFVAGGVEQMTRAPFVLPKAEAAFSRNAEIFDTALGWRFINPRMRDAYGVDSMGETAENVAQEFGVGREDQDRFALWSQQKALEAREKGRFEREIVPIEVPEGKQGQRLFDHDEFIRPGASLEALLKLKPAFRSGGTVTAGNSSGLNDGACALIVASEDAVKSQGLRVRARIVASAVVGVPPRIMGIGPVEAVRRCLLRAGLTLEQIGVLELNEAFAAQVLACLKSLGLQESDPRVNPNGGAIALGHPLGMSGARLVLTAMNELEVKSERYALCSMCVGVGQGAAMIIERA